MKEFKRGQIVYCADNLEAIDDHWFLSHFVRIAEGEHPYQVASVYISAMDGLQDNYWKVCLSVEDYQEAIANRPENKELCRFWNDKSEDGQGVKYVRADTLNEIKAQAIEEAVKEAMSGSDDPMVKAYANIMRHHANKLRGKK